MDDMISRQAVIRWVKTECNPYGKPTLDFESGKKVIEHLEQMPSVQPHRWIPVSEALPENNEEVLTTYIVNGDKNKRYTETATYYDNDDGYWSSPWDEYRIAGTRVEVIAWMPLPEPWRGGQENDQRGSDRRNQENQELSVRRKSYVGHNSHFRGVGYGD